MKFFRCFQIDWINVFGVVQLAWPLRSQFKFLRVVTWFLSLDRQILSLLTVGAFKVEIVDVFDFMQLDSHASSMEPLGTRVTPYHVERLRLPTYAVEVVRVRLKQLRCVMARLNDWNKGVCDRLTWRVLVRAFFCFAALNRFDPFCLQFLSLGLLLQNPLTWLFCHRPDAFIDEVRFLRLYKIEWVLAYLSCVATAVHLGFIFLQHRWSCFKKWELIELTRCYLK